MNLNKRRLFILLADDSRAQCETLTTLLEQAGHDVHYVHSGEEAIAFCKRYRPDLILMDLVMPGIGGIAALSHLRDSTTRYWIPVLLMGEARSPQIILEGYHAGADDFLVKPIQPALLLAKVNVFARIIRAYPQINADSKRLADYFDENESEQTLAAELIQRLSAHDPLQASRLQQYHCSQSRFCRDVVSLRHTRHGDEYLLLADFQQDGLSTAICAYSLIEGFHQLINQQLEPEQLLQRLNQHYIERFGHTRPVRFLLCHIQPAQHTLTLWNGDMDVVLLVGQDGRQRHSLASNSERLGSGSHPLLHSSTYHGWHHGDRLIVLTVTRQGPMPERDALLNDLAKLASDGPMDAFHTRFAASARSRNACQDLRFTLTLCELHTSETPARQGSPVH
ncbi:hypothetical protein THUN1379_24820 [Paludibacterium sp. THUN1379]|uniref:response regulator n=1 Tax=Paludibacterium sp. THUN1379 TaxID=3112107 RepID=UPI00308637FC|nr:hypothetical protein THUN1379_24820 [Paludibacterium sp. THUN1379]